jgi:hypothetical protein
MTQTIFRNGISPELAAFPHLLEMGLIKNSTIRLNSFLKEVSDGIDLRLVTEGKFDWLIDGKSYAVYPGDLVLLLPGQSIAGDNDILNIGSFYSVKIAVQEQCRVVLGKWSMLSHKEKLSVNQILTHNRNSPVVSLKEAQTLIQALLNELKNEEVGRQSMVNHLLDQLFIYTCRQLVRQSNLRRDFRQTFFNLEQYSIPFCTQMIADMFNRPVNTLSHGDSVGIGPYVLSATELSMFLI